MRPAAPTLGRRPLGSMGADLRRGGWPRPLQCDLCLAGQGAHGPGAGDRPVPQRRAAAGPGVTDHVRDPGRSQLSAVSDQAAPALSPSQPPVHDVSGRLGAGEGRRRGSTHLEKRRGSAAPRGILGLDQEASSKSPRARGKVAAHSYNSLETSVFLNAQNRFSRPPVGGDLVEGVGAGGGQRRGGAVFAMGTQPALGGAPRDRVDAR
jgi:hypothetical protein